MLFIVYPAVQVDVGGHIADHLEDHLADDVADHGAYQDPPPPSPTTFRFCFFIRPFFSKVLGTDVSPDDALSVARFYEGQHELGKAGRFYR